MKPISIHLFFFCSYEISYDAMKRKWIVVWLFGLNILPRALLIRFMSIHSVPISYLSSRFWDTKMRKKCFWPKLISCTSDFIYTKKCMRCTTSHWNRVSNAGGVKSHRKWAVSWIGSINDQIQIILIYCMNLNIFRWMVSRSRTKIKWNIPAIDTESNWWRKRNNKTTDMIIPITFGPFKSNSWL